MKLLRSTTSLCKNCRRTIVERKRKPCGACGSLNRIVTRYASDGLGTVDRAS